MNPVLIFVLLEIILSLCIILLPQLTLVWAILLSITPLFLMVFWTKGTLPASQNNYSLVFALTYASLSVFCGGNARASRIFYATSDFVFWMSFICIITAAALLGYLIGNTAKKHYRMYVYGVLFCIAHVCIPQTDSDLCAWAFGLLVFAVMFITASAISLHKSMALSARALKVKDVSFRLLSRNTAFTATAVNLFFVLTGKFLAPRDAGTAYFWANISCAVLSVILLFVYLKQPLEEVSEYQTQLLLNGNPDIDADLVEEQLRKRLAEEEFYPPAAFAKKILSLFFHDKVVGLEKVQETSAVFVANHYEIYGPFITELKFPRVFRPWTDNLMTDRATLTRQLRSGINVLTKKWLIKPIRKRLPAMVASPLWKTINCCRPITIARKDPEKIDRMLRESVTALKSGDSVVVFPEKPPLGQHYSDGGVDRLQTGFVEIAQKYKETTGKDVSFYPLYIDKYGKKMIVGEKVVFDAGAPLNDEKLRVADELYEQLTEISQVCRKNTV